LQAVHVHLANGVKKKGGGGPEEEYSVAHLQIQQAHVRHIIAYRNLSDEGRHIGLQTIEVVKITDYCMNYINNADETGLFFSQRLSRTFTFQGLFAMVAQNLNSRLLCSLHEVKMVVMLQECQETRTRS
jgi:hypothetical protein